MSRIVLLDAGPLSWITYLRPQRAREAALWLRLVVRFGDINDRKANPLSIIEMSLKGSGFEIQAVKPAGSASSGKRQALHFSNLRAEAREEHDIWATYDKWG